MKKRTTKPNQWSQTAVENSDSLDLEKGTFALSDPQRIARSLKRSAIESGRSKGNAKQSAMSMIIYYINRAGENLPKNKGLGRRRVLTRTKKELHAM